MAANSNQALSQYRIAEIDRVLGIEGAISNERLRQLFGFQSVQAARVLRAYLEGRFERGLPPLTRQHPKYLLPSTESETVDTTAFEQYLQIVREAGSPTSWFEDARVDFGQTESRDLRNLRQACLEGRRISTEYQSLSGDPAATRVLRPHTVVRVGRRLHVRAYCEIRQEHRDFALPRMRRLILLDHPEDPTPSDIVWDTQVDLLVRPHSALTTHQNQAVRREHFEGTQGRRFTSRAALIPYLLIELQAALDPKVETPPRYQLEVENAEEIRRHVFGSRPTALTQTSIKR